MATNKETKINDNEEDISFYPMSIIKDQKQTSIRIPKKMVEALEIESGKDIFVFTFNKKDLTLKGSLEDSKVWWSAIGKETK